MAHWPPNDPRILIATCMKDEGPFILEWLAWHQAIGITDFVVYTNDCTDGTDAILERLAAIGLVRHLPNPALATGSTYFQPVALAYTPHLPEWGLADFFLSIDVDEFVNIRAGSGHIGDLLDVLPEFDAVSLSELNHGANGHMTFAPGLMTAQFPRHQTERPGRHKALRGVKTLVRISQRLEKPRNHRPDFRDGAAITWLDGAGRALEVLAADASLNGIDVRGSYDHVVLDHFPLRSLESYLIKMARGDVVVKDHRVSRRYWRLRNRNEALTSTFERQQPAFRAAHDALMSDAPLRALHERACSIHINRAAELLRQPEYAERRAWILDNAWD
ncbi:MAG: glycosyltransferase family 2 protein [Pseudomonadota bacterium]